jgi:hypothetical protein
MIEDTRDQACGSAWIIAGDDITEGFEIAQRRSGPAHRHEVGANFFRTRAISSSEREISAVRGCDLLLDLLDLPSVQRDEILDRAGDEPGSGPLGLLGEPVERLEHRLVEAHGKRRGHGFFTLVANSMRTACILDKYTVSEQGGLHSAIEPDVNHPDRQGEWMKPSPSASGSSVV